VAGLTCARALAEAGLAVDVFDKGRGPGGRLSTRRGEGGTWDHGAPCFSAAHPDFLRAVAAWEASGHLAPWQGRWGRLDGSGAVTPGAPPAPQWVGVPGMASVVAHLAQGLCVRFGQPVTRVRREEGRWGLEGEGGARLGTWEALVVAVPPPQAAALLAEAAPGLAAAAASVRMSPVWAGLLSFASPVAVPLDAVEVGAGPLAFAVREGAKPGRPAGERWVVHASEAWTREHLEEGADAVAGRLAAAFREATGHGAPPLTAVAHRWRYARAATPLPGRMRFEEAAAVGLCGDGCGGSDVEAAFLSGRALGEVLRAWAGARGASAAQSGQGG
jgi:predicted NAD/FAD-dependent oxidoreductase